LIIGLLDYYSLDNYQLLTIASAVDAFVDTSANSCCDTAATHSSKHMLMQFLPSEQCLCAFKQLKAAAEARDLEQKLGETKKHSQVRQLACVHVSPAHAAVKVAFALAKKTQSVSLPSIF
jgi:hypothetical protein